MILGIGFGLQMSVPSPLTRRRDYEVFLRGPATAPLGGRFGTVDAYRNGEQFLGRLAVFPEPQDAFATDFGVQESGEVTVQIANPEDPDA